MNLRTVAAVTAALMLAAGCTSDASSDVGPGSIDLADIPAGSTHATFVDGHPVFVVHDEDGDVRVLDAVSPHRWDEFTKVLAWCETADGFEDLWHGSRFDRDGGYLAGPAPTGMAPYDLERRDGQVILGDRLAAPARSEPLDPGEGSTPGGPSCGERTALYLPGHPAEATVVADLVVHEPAASTGDLWYPTEERVLGNVRTHP